jgi:hypothetical protein
MASSSALPLLRAMVQRPTRPARLDRHVDLDSAANAGAAQRRWIIRERQVARHQPRPPHRSAPAAAAAIAAAASPRTRSRAAAARPRSGAAAPGAGPHHGSGSGRAVPPFAGHRRRDHRLRRLDPNSGLGRDHRCRDRLEIGGDAAPSGSGAGALGATASSTGGGGGASRVSNTASASEGTGEKLSFSPLIRI